MRMHTLICYGCMVVIFRLYLEDFGGTIPASVELELQQRKRIPDVNSTIALFGNTGELWLFRR